MSSLCLSSVLTRANLTMYQTSLSDVLLPHDSVQTSKPAHSINISAQSYRQINPHCWTEDHVLGWISDHVESTKFDASTLRLAYCAVNGPILCQMDRDQMTGVFGPQLGPQLHQSLQDHNTTNELQSLSGPELNETCQLLDHFLDNLNFPLLSTIKIGQADCQGDHEYVSLKSRVLRGSDSLSDVFVGTFDFANSPESGSSDSDPESPCPVISGTHIKIEKKEPQSKRPRGRPPKVIRDQSSISYDSPKKSKHAPRGIHLWEFIRDILIHPEKNQGLMKWEDRHEGVFKFLKSEAVAQMWGQKKRNSSMTYEKLSRAMRYYYKRNILERVDGRRLVYKFGKNSTGWKIEEICKGV